MSPDEFTRLIKLNIYCPREHLEEREVLRLKGRTLVFGAAQVALHWFFLVAGWLIVLLSLSMLLQPPITTEIIPMMVIGALLALTLLLTSSRFMKKWAKGWLPLSVRGILVLVGFIVFSVTGPTVEQARWNALPAAQRHALEVQDAEKAAAELVDIKREVEADIARMEVIVREERRKESDEEQRDFYDTLGAPKLLYRCGVDKPLRAIGATVGSINALLREAQSECGSSSFEIVKRKEH